MQFVLEFDTSIKGIDTKKAWFSHAFFFESILAMRLLSF